MRENRWLAEKIWRWIAPPLVRRCNYRFVERKGDVNVYECEQCGWRFEVPLYPEDVEGPMECERCGIYFIVMEEMK